MSWGLTLILLRSAAALRAEAPLALVPEANSTVECGEACPCPNLCSGNGECFAGKCKCFPGYTYYDCSLRAATPAKHTPPRPRPRVTLASVRVDGIIGKSSPRCAGVCPSDCSNNGFCYNATCHCNPGWKGGDCSIQTCPDECNYHGSCKLGKCVCRPGWNGDACETRTCPNGCSRQGTCVNFKCECKFGFASFDCSSLACPRDCNGKGACYNGAPAGIDLTLLQGIIPGQRSPSLTHRSPPDRHVLLLSRLARHRLLDAHLPQ